MFKENHRLRFKTPSCSSECKRLLINGADENIVDSDICVDEIESALKVLKLGKSCGIDCLDPEHIVFGGEIMKIWLKKIFNSILHFEQLPACLKEGIVVPIYKGRGKDPLLVSSYRGITLSSVITKLFEVIILRRLSPCLEDAGFPDISQTAY